MKQDDDGKEETSDGKKRLAERRQLGGLLP